MEMTIVTLSLDMPTIQFHRLSFVPDGDDVVVGRRDIDSYGVFPPDGAALVRELASGRTLSDAQQWYEATYGQRVDMDDFLASLTDLRFLRADGEPIAGDAPAVRWQAVGRALFSRPMSFLYLAIVVTAVVLAWTRPELAPRPGNVFFTTSFVVVELTIVIGQLPLSGIHELAHLLAGRRLGLPSSIRLSNRFYFVVFETSLDGLVGVPRRQRYLPMLAGLGADLVTMACLTIAAALTGGAEGSLVGGVCLALAFSTLPRIVWQFYLFLQTDLYYLAATLLGCVDLHGTSRQWLVNRFNRRLGRHDRIVDESAWHARDRRAVRWYGPLMVVGYAAAVIMAALVALPIAWRLFGGAARSLLFGDADGAPQWDAAVLLAISTAHVGLAGYLAWRDRRRSRVLEPTPLPALEASSS
jgi:hypothetical protein